MAYLMGEAKLVPARVDCDRNLEFSSCGVLQRTINFLFGDLSILTVPSRHADAYYLASFRMR
jgi:hypothetical protein